jgi:hypothetical protein|tara:strand:+ start:303 stop:491 length:189 start_codon:yes stop_codon:yes gene_type:complete
MIFDTKTWLKSIVIGYKNGVPHLLQYVINDKETDNLTKLIDSLSEFRVAEALDEYKQNEVDQ